MELLAAFAVLVARTSIVKHLNAKTGKELCILQRDKAERRSCCFYCGCYGFVVVCVSVFKESEHYLRKYTPNSLPVSGRVINNVHVLTSISVSQAYVTL